MDITEIRRRYPNPKSVHASGVQSDIDYCIGGSLCLAYAHLWDGDRGDFPQPVPHFPSTAALRVMLLKINPALPPEDATVWAQAITSANDLEHFEDAWRRAGYALNPKQEYAMAVYVQFNRPGQAGISLDYGPFTHVLVVRGTLYGHCSVLKRVLIGYQTDSRSWQNAKDHEVYTDIVIYTKEN